MTPGTGIEGNEALNSREGMGCAHILNRLSAYLLLAQEEASRPIRVQSIGCVALNMEEAEAFRPPEARLDMRWCKGANAGNLEAWRTFPDGEL